MIKSNSDTYSLFYLPDHRRFIKCFQPSTAFLQYKSFRINLLNGEKEDLSAEDFLEELDGDELSASFEKPKIHHLFYELGYMIEGWSELVKENAPLAVSLEYEKTELYPMGQEPKGPMNLRVLQYPDFEEYKEKFLKGRESLLNGDCYQFNLTTPFYFGFDEDVSPEDFIYKAWSMPLSIGAYGHCTFISELNQLLLSNSPECLFQINGGENKPFSIYSMPIKGTLKIKEESERKEAWRKLQSSLKDQAELYMITDLVRNDLTRIQMSPAKVRAKKLPLHVPGIVHQYSVVESPVRGSLSLKAVVKALFPGGSVTGAPKKRVLKILRGLEDYERGFYCGSTVILHRGLKAASINIRSCEIDFSSREMKYCAGGGITLNSQISSEFDETYAKMESFLQLLKK